MAEPILNVKKDTKGYTAAVPSIEILSYVYEKNLPGSSQTFNDIILNLQDVTKKIFAKHKPKPKEPKSGAFNNCNGRWGEYVFGAYAWNYLVDVNLNNQNNDRYVYVKLPTNNSTTKKSISNIWTSLLIESQRIILSGFEKDSNDLQVKEFGHKAFKLCSSNPDAVILKFENEECKELGIDPLKKLDSLEEGNIELIDSIFEKVRGAVSIEKIYNVFYQLKLLLGQTGGINLFMKAMI